MNFIDLFSDNESSDTKEEILDSDGDIVLFREYINVSESYKLYSVFLEKANWVQDTMMMYGRQVAIPRLNAWYADKGIGYTYSNISMAHNDWFDDLFRLKRELEGSFGFDFNCVLMNHYRNGDDSVAWHSDDEKELGEKPVICSVSLGGTRKFDLRNKTGAKEKLEVYLNDGDVLIMKGSSQSKWEHQIAKSKKYTQPRINLTFRNIVNTR